MNKKIILSVFVILISTSLFSGCSLTKDLAKLDTSGALEAKNAEISLTGKITKNGDLYFITDSAGTIHDVETYSVDFNEYVGQQVTVSGQYSGNTLFVTTISL